MKVEIVTRRDGEQEIVAYDYVPRGDSESP